MVNSHNSGCLSRDEYGQELAEKRHQGAVSRTYLGPVAKTQSLNAGGPDVIPGWGTRSHMPQLKIQILQLRPHAFK